MPIILETNKFIVSGHDQPHHDRNNGGHAKVTPKGKYIHNIDIPMDEYVELMQLVLLTGEALMRVMKAKGIPVVRINYQDNGNWSYFPSLGKEPQVHVHLYVRSLNEKHPNNDSRFRAFPNALVFPYVGENPEYYKDFKPYTIEDCGDIKAEMERLLKTEKYQELKEKI